MIEYEDITSKLKNKSYFNELFFKYNFWRKKIEKKEIFLSYTRTISSMFFISSLIAIASSNNLFIYLLIPSSIIMFLTITAPISNLLTLNEDKQIRELNDDFIQNLSQNQSIFQDLSKLVSDKESKDNFLYFTDLSLNVTAKDTEALKKLLKFFKNFSDSLNNLLNQEKQNEMLKNLNIVFNVEDKLPKEIEDLKTKQKLLEML